MKGNLKFISTKLKIPAPRKNYIKRHRLFERLKDITEYKITLIRGGAGSGKTTLLSSFLKEAFLSVGWISLDKENNNVFNFWYYFMEALRDYLDEDEVYSLFKGILNREDIERILTIIINKLQKEEDITIILDDFHLITDEILLETISFFIKYSSDNIHVVLLSREEPKLYLSDLFMRGKVLEINEDQLRLTNEEGISFLRNTLLLRTDDITLGKMNRLSEGWIGGLQLIALASKNNNEDFIKNIKVLNKHMIDYLSKEILSLLKEEEREFVIKTSILSYFTEDVCNRLLGTTNSGTMINILQEKNLFIINVDDEETAYRYHNIFNEFLKLKFREMESEEQNKLHTLAAAIFIDHGDFEEGIKHLLHIGNYKEILKIIEKDGQNPKGWNYLCQIPLSILLESKELTFQRFFYHYCNLEIHQCNEILKRIEEKTSEDPTWKVFKISKALLGDNDVDTEIISFEEMNELQLSEVTKALIYLNASVFLALQDKYNDALRLVEKASETEKKINNTYIQLFILASKAQIKEWIGDLNECKIVYDKLDDQLEGYRYLSTLAGNIHVGLAGIFLKAYDLNKAKDLLDKTRAVIYKEYKNLEASYLINLLELKILEGSIHEAKAMAMKLREDDTFKKPLFISSLLKHLIVLEDINLDELQHFIELYESYKTVNKLRIEDRLIYAKAQWLTGSVKEAFMELDVILLYTRKEKIKFYLVEAIILKLQMLSENFDKNKQEINDLFIEAITYSYENKILSPYIYGRDVVKEVAKLVLEEKRKDLNPKEIIFINEILNIIQKDTHDNILTDREYEVLLAIATGATNRDIAFRLCISLATVKTHIVNIYSKFHVSNRVEAIDKGRKLGLL